MLHAMPKQHQILMTGCSGYLGSWITMALLRAGHHVRGTTQDVDDTHALFDEVFCREDGALRHRLEIVEAELLDADSWSGLADGCDVIVHTACPVVTDVGAPRHAMIDPALVGTENVLREASRAGGVTRVVHMSSIVTLLDHHRPSARRTAEEVVGPEDWNETASPQTDPYAFAKVHGERAARALVAEQIPEAAFASVLPGPVIGPPLAGDRVAGSIDKTLAPLLTGQLRLGSVALYLGLVDVRDVATAFARVVDLPHAQLVALGTSSRFICTAQPVTSLQDMADAVLEGFPIYAPLLPRRRLPLPRALLLLGMRFSLTREAYSYTRAMLDRRVSYDTTLSQEMLGMRWRSAAESIGDTMRWLQAHGHYPPAHAQSPLNQ
ncbi:MAG: nucleoside-diphosphate-sugar epimerase [Myxococcota bacterium]|jgi:nucleoside-diphosphate-sugar epimerase